MFCGADSRRPLPSALVAGQQPNIGKRIVMIVDFHTHIFPPEIKKQRTLYWQRSTWFSELYERKKAKLATAEDLLAEMDASGVDISVACGFPWDDPVICRDCNDYLLETAGRFPGKIIAFGSVSPAFPEQAAAEAERILSAGMRGIGELNADGQGFEVTDEILLHPLVEVLEKHNAPLMIHTSEPVGHYYPGKGRTAPDLIFRLAKTFPNLKIVAAHWGGGLPFYELMPEVGEHAKNIYYDTAASPYLYRADIFKAVLHMVDINRVLYGTDFPLIRQARLLKQIRSVRLPARAEAKILGGNASALLHLGAGIPPVFSRV
ncbi:MAG: amidohydrolase family protein [Chloroflexi bacterium]|nr:amidohydrolase family protein [Chloroflexota bacterium]